MTKTMRAKNEAVRWKMDYTQNVEKYLVHKSFNSEVFLTDYHKINQHTFEIAAFLPRTHIYYNDTLEHTKHDIALLFEIFRQSSIFIAHKFYDAALDSKFIFDSADFAILNNEVLDNSLQNYQALVKINVLKVKYKKGLNYGLLLDMHLFINFKEYSKKTMDMSWLSPKIYQRVRGELANSNMNIALDVMSISPKLLGRNNATNIVIAQLLQQTQYFQATIIPNQKHPVFFDHPLDHIPASLLFEALRQSALLAIKHFYHLAPANVQLSKAKMNFKAFCELYNQNICLIQKENCIKSNNTIKIVATIEADDVICATSWFDFGGVLSPPINDLFEIYYTKSGIKPEQLKNAMLDVANTMNVPMLAPIENALITEKEWGKLVRDSLKKLYPKLDTTNARLEYFGEQWFENIAPNDSMILLFKQLKFFGYKVGILTNNVLEWESHWRSMVNLDDYADMIVDSCKFQCRKPDKKFFEIAEKSSNAQASENLLIDDLKENCEAANKMGWQTIQFIDNQQVYSEIARVLNYPKNLFISNLPYITDIPHYDCKQSYKVLSQKQDKIPEMIEILSGHKVYHITQYDDVKIILNSKYCIRKPTNQVGGASVLPTLTPDELLLNLDGEEHTRMKQFAMKEYSLSSLSSYKSNMEEIITKHLMLIAKDKNFDLLITLDNIILEINANLLGIDFEVYKQILKPLSKTIQIADSNHTDILIQDFTKMYHLILQTLQDTKLFHQDGIIANFIKSKNNAKPALNDKELCGLLLGSILGGYQNALTFISKMLYAILYFPQFWNLLLTKRNLCENILYEFLRLTNLGTTSTFPRITIEDIILSDCKIPKNSVVYADVFLANRDSLIFTNPTQINPFRLNSRQHLQFGRGIHSCMGQYLIKLEAYLMLNALLDAVPNIQLNSTIPIKWTSGVILHRPEKIPVINNF